jgi:DNA-directed RNA polymerase specialized sigma subunit
MTTKDYLNQVGRLNRMINNKLVEIAQLKELACSISAIQTGERVQATPNYDKIGTAYAKIDEMERKLDKLIDTYVDKKNHIIGQIDGIEDEMLYNILFARYIERKTFEKIATELEYSWRQIIRLHGKALKQFENQYGREYLER